MEHPNYPKYIVYTDGRIWSEKSNIWMKSSSNKDGYKKIKLMIKGAPHHLLVHRLVAQTYISNPNNYDQVNHINGQRDDNRVKNLEWCNHVQNHMSINMVQSNFGTVGIVMSHQKPVWRHSLRILKRDYCKDFQTQNEALLYRIILKYCFYVNNERERANKKTPTQDKN